MYSLKQLVISGRKRRWILMDLETSLPLLYPLRYHIDHLAFRSLSTQSASLQSVKFFYEFWRQKYGVSFCYSFYSSDHNPDIAVGEMPAFWMYLENGHNVQSNVLSLTRVTKANSLTHTVRVRAVIHFISFLINTYISPAYRDDSPKALSLLASRLHTRLQLCRENYRTLTSNKFSQHSHSSQGFRNFLIIRLLLNYGLRTGELLLLECSSIKPNLKGDKFSLIVTTVDEAYEPRKNAPSLKNAWANRVLELDKQDYIFLSIYIAKLRPKTDKHDFIFTSSQQSAKPLSYTSVHSIFSKIDQVFTNQYPEYKSPLYSDSLQRLTPHTTRHTWAFLTLQKIWHLKYLKSQQNKTHFIAEVPSLSGIMEEAKDELRLMGGWSPTSQMPDLYAKRFLSEQANAANVQRIIQDNAALHNTLDTIMDRYNDDII